MGELVKHQNLVSPQVNKGQISTASSEINLRVER